LIWLARFRSLGSQSSLVGDVTLVVHLFDKRLVVLLCSLGSLPSFLLLSLCLLLATDSVLGDQTLDFWRLGEGWFAFTSDFAANYVPTNVISMLG
jgi:hypothetical protein